MACAWLAGCPGARNTGDGRRGARLPSATPNQTAGRPGRSFRPCAGQNTDNREPVAPTRNTSVSPAVESSQKVAVLSSCSSDPSEATFHTSWQSVRAWATRTSTREDTRISPWNKGSGSRLPGKLVTDLCLSLPGERCAARRRRDCRAASGRTRRAGPGSCR